MAHYCYINENNEVTEVIVGPDEGTEPEGITSWEDYFSQKGKGRALRTSYNRNFRHNFAGIGYTFDPDFGEDGAFIPPQPFDSWVLSTEKVLWEAPIPYPEDGSAYYWDEDSGDWLEIVE